MNKRGKAACKYPGCVRYKKGARSYCTNGCAWDHADAQRLGVRFSHKK